MKILEKENNFTNDVQENIKILLNKYGNKFNIKYNKYIIQVITSNYQ